MIARLLISQSLDKRLEEAEKILTEGGLTKNHVDCLYFHSDAKLGIEQARIIKKHFSLKPYSAKGRAVVLEDASLLTIEAQNALLKILEEPPSNAILILGAASEAKFLPTILSRCQIVNLSPPVIPMASEESPDSKSIEELMASPIEKRFEYIEKLKDREGFLRTLLAYFHKVFRSSPSSSNLNFLKELLQAEEWDNQNVNLRAILEYLMLKMPSKS